MTKAICHLLWISVYYDSDNL